MDKVTDYKVVNGSTSNELTRNVKVAMGNGWQPIGPLVSNGNFLYQTMVKYDKACITKER